MKTCKDCARLFECFRSKNPVVGTIGGNECKDFTPDIKSLKPDFKKESLYVKAMCEVDGSIVEGMPDMDWNMPCVRDCKTNQNRSVFDWSICKRTGITDKDQSPIYEYDLLELTKFSEKTSYGYIVWSDFYRRYVIKRSAVYSGHCNVEDFTIKVVGNVILNSQDQQAIVKQDDIEREKESFIDNSYCPSQFKK